MRGFVVKRVPFYLEIMEDNKEDNKILLEFKEPFYQEHEMEKEIEIKVDDKYYWINYEEWKAVRDFYKKWGL